jgi:hypothetical protein
MKESLSALIDHEIKEELALLLHALKKEPTLKATYLAWQITSASMQHMPVLSPSFASRFSARLAAEPVLKQASTRMIRYPTLRWGMAASVLLVTLMTWQGGDKRTVTEPFTLHGLTKNEGVADYVAAHRMMVGGATIQKDVPLSYLSRQVSVR